MKIVIIFSFLFEFEGLYFVEYLIFCSVINYGKPGVGSLRKYPLCKGSFHILCLNDSATKCYISYVKKFYNWLSFNENIL